jgi:sugar phosphate isomerase/epimerase
MTKKHQLDLSKLCIHSITTKPWSLAESVEKFQAAGVAGISVWQDAAEAIGLKEAKKLLTDSDLEIISYVRGGFFPHTTLKDRQRAIDHNKQLIDEAAEIGAPLLVLVCGAEPQQLLSESRKQIREGIEAIIPYAEANNIKLGIEPLHPMYADTRSAIVNMAQANDTAEQIDHDLIGVVIDVYHLWWDDQLESEIKRCGKHNNIFAFHTCDWKVPTEDMLTDRGLMGEGAIPTRQIRQWVEAAGFNGFIEVEIFSNHFWSLNQNIYLNQIIEAYKNYA